MNQSINIVTEALEYYDKNTKQTNKVFSKVKYFKLINNDLDTEHNKIIFYDSNKQELFKSRYEMIGKYFNDSQTWIWAWAIPRYAKNNVYTIKKLLNYGIDIPPRADIRFLKSELVTSRYRVTDSVQLDIHVSLASYIAKIPMIYKFPVIPEITLKDRPHKQLLKVIPDDILLDITDYHINYLYLLDYIDILQKSSVITK